MARRRNQRQDNIDLSHEGGGSGEGDGEQAGALPALATTLDSLQQVLSMARPNKDLTKRLLDRVIRHGEQHGFTSAEATRVVRLALRGGHGNKPIASANSTALLRSIQPAPNELIGETFVLMIIGSLGGESANVVLELKSRRQNTAAAEDSSDESASEYEEDESGALTSADSERQSGRKMVDVRIQARALRVILNMLAPPPIVSLGVQGANMDDQFDAGPRRAILPSSFFTNAARRALDRCYGLLFQFIDYESLRPGLCHILCHITRRKHIRHHRIVKILHLRSKLPSDVYVLALLNTYAAFYPDMLFSESTTTRQELGQSPYQVHGLRYPSTRWLLDVNNLWNSGSGDNRRRQAQTQEPPKSIVGRPSKDKKAATLAYLVPSPSVLVTHDTTLAITEISSFRELGYRMDKMQMPDQLACGLAHRATMITILSAHVGRQMIRSFARVHHWAMSAISDCMRLPHLIAQGSLPFERSDTAHENSATLLKALCGFVTRVGGCDERLQNRLARILSVDTWKQLQAQEKKALLSLVELFLPCEQRNFEEQVLQPLLGVASQADDDETSWIVQSLANMLANWAAQDWLSIYRRLEDGQEMFWGAVPLSTSVSYTDTIAHVIARTAHAATDLLARRPHSIAVLHACLSLHETIFVEEFVGLHDLLLPPSFMLYVTGFTPYGAVMSLSRQMGLVHNIRQMHERFLTAKADGEASDTTALDGQSIPRGLQERRSNFFSESCSDMINDCVILLVDLIWRNNGFASVEDGNVNVGLPLDFFYALSSRCQGRGDELQRIGSASHSASLGVLMEAYANDLARNRGAARPVLHGPLTPSMLKLARRDRFPIISHRDFRDSFLTWLAQHGARGISDLLTSTITRFIRGAQEVDQSTMLA